MNHWHVSTGGNLKALRRGRHVLVAMVAVFGLSGCATVQEHPVVTGDNPPAEYLRFIFSATPPDPNATVKEYPFKAAVCHPIEIPTKGNYMFCAHMTGVSGDKATVNFHCSCKGKSNLGPTSSTSPVELDINSNDYKDTGCTTPAGKKVFLRVTSS